MWIWRGGFDNAGAITVAGGRLVTIAIRSAPSEPDDAFILAHDAQTGQLAWSDRIALSVGPAWMIDHIGDFVFVATGIQGADSDILVQAYDAATGNTLWSDLVDKGQSEMVFALAVSRDAVFIAGTSGIFEGASLHSELLVRAYDARSGALLWEDFRPGSDAADADVIATDGNLVFVAGNTFQFEQSVVRAYDSRSGIPIWEARSPSAVAGGPMAMTANHRHVYVGSGGSETLHAYDALSGKVVWQRQVGDYVWDLGSDATQVFASGEVVRSGSQVQTIVRSYDGRTGELVWDSSTNATIDQWTAFPAIFHVAGKLLLGASTTYPPRDPDATQFQVRAYSTKTGQIVW